MGGFVKQDGDSCPCVFRSAVSMSFYLSISISVALFLALLVVGLNAGSLYFALLVFLICMPIIGVHHLLYYKTQYIITADELIIKSPGSKEEHIPLKNIMSLKRTKSLISAKALSSDRVEIRTKRNSQLYISPVDPDQFINIINAYKSN